MDASGFVYAATMTNELAQEISEEKWDDPLIKEVDTLRKLFFHVIRVRDIYSDALRSGVATFPGTLPSHDKSITEHLERSKNELAHEFANSTIEIVNMGAENLTLIEFMSTAVQHEGIHQGQYFVALKQAGLKLPEQWRTEWNM